MKKKKKNLVQLLNLIISVKEARKLLGVEANNMTDKELENHILDLTELAQELLKHKQSGE